VYAHVYVCACERGNGKGLGFELWCVYVYILQYPNYTHTNINLLKDEICSYSHALTHLAF